VRRTSFEDMNCSVAQCLEVVGEWWSLLILRDVFLGVRRFDDFQARLGISRNVLNQRLSRLVEQGILKRVSYQQHPPRHEYRLTDKGRDLWLVVTAMRQWGDKWAAPDGPPVDLVHITCGHVSQAVPTCSQCHETLDVRDVGAVPGPGSRDPDLTSREATRASTAGTSAQRSQRRRDSAATRAKRGPRIRGR
jgi:DNA-binding HxlR family transcriptional regulator